jgi:hypothetical protein
MVSRTALIVVAVIIILGVVSAVSSIDRLPTQSVDSNVHQSTAPVPKVKSYSAICSADDETDADDSC